MNLVKSQDKDINQQKSFAFLMKIITIKKQKENLSNPFHLQLQQKRIKYLGINLNKETKELYTENYKTLMKEIKDHIKRWKDIPSSWIGK